MRRALTAAAALATLAFANAAFAANTGSIAIWHTPMVLAGSQSTTIHVTVPQSTDPIAATNIYVPSGYGVNVGQPAGTSIGTVDATAFSRDNSLTLPLSGTVVTDNPANFTAQSTLCAHTPTSQAVWILNLSVAGNTLQVPLYVNPTTGPEQALGAYKLSICLPPPDVPVGTPGRAPQGAQLLDALITVNGVFTTPTAGALLKCLFYCPPRQHCAFDPLRKISHAFHDTEIAQHLGPFPCVICDQTVECAEHFHRFRATFPLKFHRHQ